MKSKYGFDVTNKHADLHKKVETNFPTRGVIAFKPMDILACDLVDYSKIPRRGFHYILNCVDVFSRKVESSALKSKSSKDIQKGFDAVIARFGSTPKKIWFDHEGGIISGDTTKYLGDRHIELYHSFGFSKVSIVERFNRTQKSLLYRYEMADPSHKWSDFIQTFSDRYNDTKHSCLGMTPNEAFTSKQKEALEANLKNYYEKRDEKTALKVGDRVRIVSKGGKFTKGYVEKWSREIYNIREVSPTNPLTYIVADDQGNAWQGRYYAQELQLAT
jgi:hypothetical protein